MEKPDEFVQALGKEAVEQLAEIRAYRIYQGENPDYARRAKMAIGVVGAYVRLRATLANERSNDLIERRLLGPRGGDALALPAGPELQTPNAPQ
jgi:hypothetical protein